MQNALSFKKMYTLLGLSCLVIKLQHKKWTNVSFAVVFVVKVSCVLNLKFWCIANALALKIRHKDTKKVTKEVRFTHFNYKGTLQ